VTVCVCVCVFVCVCVCVCVCVRSHPCLRTFVLADGDRQPLEEALRDTLTSMIKIGRDTGKLHASQQAIGIMSESNVCSGKLWK
jgi:hypothetical protein